VASGVMWTEKYRPQNPAQIIGNEDAKAKFLKWLTGWKPGSKATLLYGPPGTGKTTLVQTAAKAFSYDLVGMNASDTRTEEAVMKVAGHAAKESSLDMFFSGSRGTLLFLDEVDGLYGREDRGGVGAISRVIGKSGVPVVLAANDPSNPRIRELHEQCEMIKFYEIRPPVILALLEEICRKENIKAEREALERIAVKSQGDVRSAINDLQAAAETRRAIKASDIEIQTQRDRQLNISDTLKAIFLSVSPQEVRRAQLDSAIDYETLFQSINDNLPYQYTDPEELAQAYDRLSRADVYFGRIRRTGNYGLLSYALEQMTLGVASARRHPYQPIAYKFPPRKFILLSQTRAQRALREEVLGRIGAKCHLSKRKASEGIAPFLRLLFKGAPEDVSRLAEWLGLDEKMVSYLGGEVKPRAEVSRRRREKGRRS